STWARLETTSLTFMLDWVPDPVCQMTNGNWSANWPASISSHTWAMRSRFSAGSIPASALVYAAAFLRYANASMISLGIEAEGPILKLLRERSVCAPQYLSAGTCTSPMVSCSIRYDMESLFLYVAKVRRYRRCENVSHIALRRWLNSSPAIPISNVPAAIASIRGACGMGVRANPETPCAIKSNSFHITPAT